MRRRSENRLDRGELLQQLETEQSQAQDDDEVDDVAVGQWAAMQALDGAQHPIGEKIQRDPDQGEK